MAKEKGLKWEQSKKFKSEIIKEADAILAKPQAFMNLSGEAAKKIIKYYDLLSDDLSDILTVIHDDLDIDLGKYKISIGSRSAGHNGVQSIIDILQTKNFKRIRIGIRTPDLEKMPAERFVLGRFKKEELDKIKKVISEIEGKILQR
jgi:PTH1 family peptidyl-tRNA hydrolase